MEPEQMDANPGMRPKELWRVTTPDGRCVRATLVPGPRSLIVAWHIDDKPEGAEEFEDWQEALNRANALRMLFLQRQES
jgi:hypothetical protein